MAQQIELTAIISKNQFGRRLDKALAETFPEYSRSSIKRWILSQRVLVNGKIKGKPEEKILGGETVTINAEIKEEMCFKAQNIPLNIIYEDDSILIINKPYNLVVHPGTGNPDGTLLNALLNYHPSIVEVPRAGIIHRLDKDTTGLMIVAKTIPVQIQLMKSLQLREIIREYEAIVNGRITKNGTINKQIRRHPIKHTHMFVHSMGKSAITHYRIMENFRIHTRLRLRLETGRTHQIRVHMAHISHPIVGDQVYGGRPYLPKQASEAFINVLRKFNRQALHAVELQLYHPVANTKMKWHAPIPQDMAKLIEIMRSDFRENKR